MLDPVVVESKGAVREGEEVLVGAMFFVGDEDEGRDICVLGANECRFPEGEGRVDDGASSLCDERFDAIVEAAALCSPQPSQNELHPSEDWSLKEE